MENTNNCSITQISELIDKINHLETLVKEYCVEKKQDSKTSTRIIDKIKTYEDACEILGEDSEGTPLMFSSKLNRKCIAFIKLDTITKALNEGWEPVWSDKTSLKFFPDFVFPESYKKTEPIKIEDIVVKYTTSRTWAFSPFCYKDAETAVYAGKQFITLYNELYSYLKCYHPNK